jgi:hypothetical protein
MNDLDDCANANDQVWAVPGEVRSLLFGDDKHTLSWSAPQSPGGMAPVYDTIRSDWPDDFLAGECVESDDGADTQSFDADPLGTGAAYYYLVCAENSCGRGTAGFGEAERQAAPCP